MIIVNKEEKQKADLLKDEKQCIAFWHNLCL